MAKEDNGGIVPNHTMTTTTADAITKITSTTKNNKLILNNIINENEILKNRSHNTEIISTVTSNQIYIYK